MTEPADREASFIDVQRQTEVDRLVQVANRLTAERNEAWDTTERVRAVVSAWRATGNCYTGSSLAHAVLSALEQP